MRKMILGTAGLIVSDNKTDEVAETGQETATTETNAEAKTYYVKSGAANIRECPSTSCKIINTLPQNTELTFPGDLFDKYPDWAEITFEDGRVGYINKTTLSSELSSVAPAKPSSRGNGIFLGEGNFDPLIIGYSYSISFCVPESARSGATCGGLAGDTQTPVGGSPPYSIVKGSGFLPPGMSLELNGLLSGAPTTAGTYNFQICAKDLKMNQGCQSYKIVVVKEEETTLVTPVVPEPIATEPTTPPVSESKSTIDSARCILVKSEVEKYGSDTTGWTEDVRYTYRIEAAGTATGPEGTTASVGTNPIWSTDYPAEFNFPSWTINEVNPYTGRPYQWIRASGNPPTTAWSAAWNDMTRYRSENGGVRTVYVNLLVIKGDYVSLAVKCSP